RARLDHRAHAAAVAAALHLPAGHVVDHLLAAVAAARGLDVVVAGEGQLLLVRLVHDAVGARAHGAAVVHLLAHPRLPAGEHDLSDVAVAALHLGTVGVDL